LASLPLIGSPAMSKNVRSLENKAKASQDILNSVRFATLNSWYYDATKYLQCLSLMSAEEQREWPCDMRKMKWPIVGAMYSYGIAKYYLK